MKKLVSALAAMTLAAVLAAGLAACGVDESVSGATSPDVSPGSGSSSFAASSAQDSSQSTVSLPGGAGEHYELDYANEPPVSAYVQSMAVPDFLDEAQAGLYRRVRSIFSAFEGAPETVNWFPLPDGTEFSPATPYEMITIDGHRYCKAQGRYRLYEDFERTCLSLFTADYFEALRKGRFLNIDGFLFYVDAGIGSNFGYEPEEMPDTFELVSKTEDEIKFNVIGHYYTEGYVEGVVREGYTTAKFPITMARRGQLWRFSEFHTPSAGSGFGQGA